MIDTFSSNSLKILENSKEDFIKKYINKLEFIPENIEAKEGNKLHALISYYLKGYKTEKFETADFKKEIFTSFKNSDISKIILSADKKYIEYPFFIKEYLNNSPFYLTGRVDCVILKDNIYTIFDWKTGHIPKNPVCDIQTIVYMHAISKIFNTTNINMVYYSLFDQKSVNIKYEKNNLDKIKEIIKKAN